MAGLGASGTWHKSNSRKVAGSAEATAEATTRAIVKSKTSQYVGPGRDTENARRTYRVSR